MMKKGEIKVKNYIFEKLKNHIGHNLVCVAYGEMENPADICIECEDCCEVLVSAQNFVEIPLVATDIEWDTDGKDVDLPTEIEIPEGMTELNVISNYISDKTGFCHFKFRIKGKYNDENKDTYKTFLYNSIISWYDDAFTEYHGLEDPDFIERVCAKVGMTEEEYKELMELPTA